MHILLKITHIGLKIAGGCGYCSKNNPFRSLYITTRIHGLKITYIGLKIDMVPDSLYIERTMD